MLTPDLEIELQTLSYLVTTAIHRLHETDPAWWQQTLQDIKAERSTLIRGTASADRADKVLTRAIALVEHALAADEPPQKPKHGRGAHGK